MSTTTWNWKGKDGVKGGLLYEPGNWGDLLKLSWATIIGRWKQRAGRSFSYFDPFAGDVCYPLGNKTLLRFGRVAAEDLGFIRASFLDHGAWPSTASSMLLLGADSFEVFDLDDERRGRWRAVDRANVLEGDSGWRLLAEKIPDERGLWLIDPYDFLAEWREALPIVLGKLGGATMLLYLYNRSARKPEAFREYRAFRNALEDGLNGWPIWLGRAAGDGFLPGSHHEMILLPGTGDVEREDFPELSIELEQTTLRLASAIERTGIFDF